MKKPQIVMAAILASGLSIGAVAAQILGGSTAANAGNGPGTKIGLETGVTQAVTDAPIRVDAAAAASAGLHAIAEGQPGTRTR